MMRTILLIWFLLLQSPETVRNCVCGKWIILEETLYVVTKLAVLLPADLVGVVTCQKVCFVRRRTGHKRGIVAYCRDQLTQVGTATAATVTLTECHHFMSVFFSWICVCLWFPVQADEPNQDTVNAMDSLSGKIILQLAHGFCLQSFDQQMKTHHWLIWLCILECGAVGRFNILFDTLTQEKMISPLEKSITCCMSRKRLFQETCCKAQERNYQ